MAESPSHLRRRGQCRCVKASSCTGRQRGGDFPRRTKVHTVQASMRPVRTLSVLAALLAAGAATGAPRARPTVRPALELRATLRSLSESRASAAHVLRDMPTPVESPGAYARVS